ncbi:MAG: ASCH domain-containing protein [Anaerolineaceae bacterium]|nr:ASCH domain-containing protein [Anaerolineaceae bacterium]MDD5367495.1 ASCH domain-containing protein [Anaerolineaceae bacterium]
MKALTLIQPWATLVAIGAKRIETRSWSTGYRGPLAIHSSSSKQFINMRGKDYICGDEPFYSVLTEASKRHTATLTDLKDMVTRPFMPLGCIIATCELIGCGPIADQRTYIKVKPQPLYNCVGVPPEEPELSFGDYTTGRFAWVLANVKPLPEPIPAKGALGLWEWKQNRLGLDRVGQP